MTIAHALKLPLVVSTVVVLGGISSLAIAAGWTKHDVSIELARGSTTTNATEAPQSALSGFKLEFRGGDHEIKSIGVIRDSNSVTTTFADNDGNDAYRMWAQYTAVPMRVVDATGDCSEVCEIAIERPPSPGAQLVIRGFSVQRNGSDANLRRIAIDPDPDRGVVTVEFSDNGRSYYRARVQYGYVDATHVAGTHRASGQRRRQEQSLVLPRVPGQPMLQGFDVRFRTGDHHLRTFAIEPTATAYRVTFNDNNTDDEYQVSVDYLVLK